MNAFKKVFPSLRIRKHFTLQLDGKKIIYCYLRKNACSAFKELFVGESPFRYKHNGHPLSVMGGFHKTRARDLLDGPVTSIVVLRDPYERLISLYLNKFVTCSGNNEIFENYRQLTGRAPEKATFREFLTAYVDRFSFRKLDCHLLPQIDHLGSFPYTAPVRLEHLAEDLTRVLGAEKVSRYFVRKVNATSYAEEAVAAHTFDCNTSPEVLIRSLLETGSVPSKHDFMCPELEHTIATRYREDLMLFDTLNAAYRRSAPGETPVLDLHLWIRRQRRLAAPARGVSNMVGWLLPQGAQARTPGFPQRG